MIQTFSTISSRLPPKYTCILGCAVATTHTHTTLTLYTSIHIHLLEMTTSTIIIVYTRERKQYNTILIITYIYCCY